MYPLSSSFLSNSLTYFEIHDYNRDDIIFTHMTSAMPMRCSYVYSSGFPADHIALCLLGADANERQDRHESDVYRCFVMRLAGARPGHCAHKGLVNRSDGPEIFR